MPHFLSFTRLKFASQKIEFNYKRSAKAVSSSKYIFALKEKIFSTPSAGGCYKNNFKNGNKNVPSLLSTKSLYTL